MQNRFHSFEIIGSSAQGVSAGVLSSWPMHDVKVVRAQGLPPAYLTSIEFLGGGEVYEVFVVCVDGDWECGSFKIVSPFLAGGNDCHKLLVVYLIIKLCRCKFLGKECNGVE